MNMASLLSRTRRKTAVIPVEGLRWLSSEVFIRRDDRFASVSDADISYFERLLGKNEVITDRDALQVYNRCVTIYCDVSIQYNGDGAEPTCGVLYCIQQCTKNFVQLTQ